MNHRHPYKRYEKTAVWRAIEQGVADLIENGDISESTPRDYVVGYLTKQVLDARLTSRQLRAVREKIAQTRAASEELVDVLSDLDKTSVTR